jgi:hypothetical protein
MADPNVDFWGAAVRNSEGLAVLTCSDVSLNGLARVIPFHLLTY